MDEFTKHTTDLRIKETKSNLRVNTPESNTLIENFASSPRESIKKYTNFNPSPEITVSIAKSYSIDNKCRVHFLMDNGLTLKGRRFYGRRLAKRYAKNAIGSMVKISLVPIIPLEYIHIGIELNDIYP